MDSITPGDFFYDPSDFVGSPTDDVDSLQLQLYFEVDTSDLVFSGFGGTDFYAYFDVYMEAGDVTLQYVYDDALGSIPEPATASALFGLLALGSIAVRRRR